MVFRDLVMGGAGCTVPGTRAYSNPLGGLADSIFGCASKTQERIKELPSFDAYLSEIGYAESLPSLPGLEDQRGNGWQSASQSFHGHDYPGFSEAWSEVNVLKEHPEGILQEKRTTTVFSEFEQIYELEATSMWHESQLDRTPNQILSDILRSFVDSSRADVISYPVQLPELGLSETDKRRIRDRSSIIAQHLFADKGDGYVNAQVTALLYSLRIDSNLTDRRLQGGHLSWIEEYWNETQGGKVGRSKREHCEPLENSHPWVEEFDQQYKFSTKGSQNDADQFQLQHNNVRTQLYTEVLGDTWVGEYSHPENQETSTTESWLEEYLKFNMQGLDDEFCDQLSNGILDENLGNTLMDADEKCIEKQLEKNLLLSSKWVYSFADPNPYVGHQNPSKDGQKLFRNGLLSEAILALEAEVRHNPGNAEVWQLLGITHAENDNDLQAIASMVQARHADPNNLEVLLALGVSHTNELEKHEALKCLQTWLQQHPKYGRLLPTDLIKGLNHANVTCLFHEAAQISPEDGDIHMVLGVLYNLSQEYDKAIGAFHSALKLNPRDYSLWNKVGATQANRHQNAEALYAYQKALDLKPNYVRAWSNLSNCYANQGRYDESLRFNVRALCMNPKADNGWQYLRIYLRCAEREDLLDACDRRDLDLLQKEYSL